MRKNLLFLFAILFAIQGWSQGPTLNEDFDGIEFPPEDWATATTQGTVTWERYTSSTPRGTASASVNYQSGGHINYLITPKLIINSVDDEISFWVKCPTYYSGTTLNVLISTTDNAVGSFEASPLLSLVDNQITITWTQHTIELEDYIGEEVYIAFQIVDDYGMRVMLDDVEGPELFVPTCIKPKNLSFSNVTTSSIDVEFEPGSEFDYLWNVYYRVVGDIDWDLVSVSSNPFTLDNLSLNTEYEIKIITDCGNEVSDPSATYIFRTNCEAVADLPWSDNFDTYGTAVGTRPNCWSFPVIYSNFPAIVTAQSVSSPSSIKFQSDIGEHTYAITPQIAEDINELRVKFNLKKEGSNSGTMEVGIMSDNADISTFELVEVIEPSSTTFNEYEVSFANTIINGPNNYIAFRHDSDASSWFYWLDDVEVSYIPDCAKPFNLNATNITDTEATISWEPARIDDYAWYLYYKLEDETDWESIQVFSIPHTLSDLESNSDYEYYLRTDCGGELSEESMIASFHTPCVPIDAYDGLPWEEGFEDLTAANTLPDCWSATSLGGKTNTQIINHNNYNRNARTGTGAAYFNWSCDDSFTTPVFYLYEDEVYEFSFWYVTDGSTGWESLKASINNPDGSKDDIGTSLQNITNSNYEEYAANFQVDEEGFYSFNIECSATGSPWYLTFDDVMLREAPNCLRPTDLELVSTTTTDIEIDWEPGNDYDAFWYVYFKRTGEAYWDSVQASYRPFTITNLQTSSGYEIYVRTDCGNELSDESIAIFASTECDIIAELPWYETFDAYPNESGVRPECWSFPVIHNDCPEAVTNQSNSLPSSLKFQSPQGVYTYAITPQLFDDINSLRVKFMLKAENIINSGTMEVGVMSDNEDTSSFELVEVISPESTNFLPYEITFANVNLSGGDNYIAFRHNTVYDNWCYWLDDVEISYIPDCARPTDITYEGATENSIDLSWLPGNIGDMSWWVYYRVLGTDDWDSVNANTNTQYTLANLSSSVAYEIMLRTDCGGGEISEESSIKTFRTECGPIVELPWMDDFDSYGTGTSVFPDCWTRNTTYADRPYVNSTNYSGIGSLYFFVGDIGTYNIAALPKIDESIDISDLRLNFMYRKTNATDILKVGVMEDPDDETTWEEIEVIIIPGTNTWNPVEVVFSSYEGSANYIALRIDYASSVIYANVDDVVLSYIPDCARPTNIEVENIMSDSFDISWTPGREGDNSWYVYYKELDETDWDSVITTNNPFTLDNLDDNTIYEIYIRTDCFDESSDATATIQVRTNCEAIVDLPWTEDFDTYGTSAGTKPDCWAFPVVSGNYPGISTTNAVSSNTSLMFSSQIGVPSYAVSPQFADDINEIMITFQLKSENITHSGNIEVGVMSNSTDISTFELVETINPGDNSFHQYEIGFGGTTLSGPNNYIAFRHNTNNAIYYYWLDDVVVDYLPDCVKPVNLSAINITSDEADLTWNPGHADDYAWWLYFREEGETDWDSVYTVNNPYTWSGLSDDTEYEFAVATDCGGEISEKSTIFSFKTPCVPIDGDTDLPWEEGFEDLTAATTLPPCWSATGFGAQTNTQIVDYGSYNRNARTGTGAAYFRWSADDSFTTPEFYLYEYEDYEFSFWYVTDGLNGWQELKAVLNLSDGTTQVLGDIVITPMNTTYLEYSASFQVPEDGEYTIDIVCEATSSPYYLTFDDVMLRYAPDCIKPSGISASDQTSTTAELSWTPGKDTDNAWWILYREAGEADWDSVYTNDNPHTLTGLTPASRYEIAIRTDCVTEVSDLSSNYFFNVSCYDGPITDFPWEEGFESGIFCWEQDYTQGNIDWAESATYTEPRTGIGYATFYHASSTLTSTMLVSPQLDISAMVSPYVSFWHTQEKWLSDQDELKVYYRESDSDNWSQIAHYTTDLPTYVLDSVALPNPSSTYQIAFEGLSNYGKGISLDDITVYDADADGCAPPTGLTVTPSNVSAVVTWTPAGGELDWEVRLGQNGTPETVGTPSHTLSGLDASTNYTVYVRSNCGTGYSNWVSASFTTTDAQVAPEVTASVAAAQITQTTAVLTGEYLQGSDMIESKGFEYKKASETDWEEVEVSGNDNPYTYQATDLVADTDYEVRAYVVTDTEGTTYSDIVEFTTLAIIPPTVTTDGAQVDNEAKKATFTGTTTQNTEQIIARGFEYKEENADWSDAIDLTASGSTTITATTPVLENEQRYTVRAYAETNSGKTYGDELDFETTSSLTTIDIDNLDITLYPNPATSTTTISIKGIDGKATISIIDIQGRTITSIDKNSSSNEIKHSFSLENLSKGVYYIRVEASNSVKTQKLIVQ